jgi:hypothetical protein
MDPMEGLKKIVKDTGRIDSVYGGFEVKVLKPKSFPWHQVINQLIEIGQKVWVEKKEGKIYIVSEPNIQ